MRGQIQKSMWKIEGIEFGDPGDMTLGFWQVPEQEQLSQLQVSLETSWRPSGVGPWVCSHPQASSSMGYGVTLWVAPTEILHGVLQLRKSAVMGRGKGTIVCVNHRMRTA